MDEMMNDLMKEHAPPAAKKALTAFDKIKAPKNPIQALVFWDTLSDLIYDETEQADNAFEAIPANKLREMWVSTWPEVKRND